MTCLVPVRPTKIAPGGGGGVVITDRRVFWDFPLCHSGYSMCAEHKYGIRKCIPYVPPLCRPHMARETGARGSPTIFFVCHFSSTWCAYIAS